MGDADNTCPDEHAWVLKYSNPFWYRYACSMCELTCVVDNLRQTARFYMGRYYLADDPGCEPITDEVRAESCVCFHS